MIEDDDLLWNAPFREDDLSWKTTFHARRSLMEVNVDGRHPLNEEDLAWGMTFNRRTIDGRWPLIKMTYDGKVTLIKEDLQ